MYLAVSADMSQADLISKAPQLIKVCSADAVEHLVQRALPGVALTHVISPPAAIPIKLNCQYFGLSQSGGSWEAVVRARNLAAYVPGDFPKPQMELIIVLPQAG
jgi:type VI secretion system protein ImpJ